MVVITTKSLSRHKRAQFKPFFNYPTTNQPIALELSESLIQQETIIYGYQLVIYHMQQ
jgi:hypothetical protein